MKNVALVIYSCPSYFPPTINAADLLAEQGYSVHLLGIKYPRPYDQRATDKVNTVYMDDMKVGIRGLISYIKSIFFLFSFLRKQKIDLVVGYDAKSVLPLFLATLGSRTKWVFHQHDYWDKPAGLWERFIWRTERWLPRFADAVSFPQQDRADFFAKEARLKDAPVIVHNGPRKEWLSATVQPDPVVVQMRSKYQYLLIYQGGWSKYFKLERIFDALALCPGSVGLVMLGEGREKGLREHYEQYLEQLHIRERVYLADTYIAYNRLVSFTRFADAAIAILTGEFDEAPFNNRYLIGASNKITEYVACGLPVIIQDSAPNRRFLERYPIGVLTDTNNAQAFAHTIVNLLTDASSERQRKSNIDLFNAELNFDAQFDKLLKVVNEE